MEITDVKVIPVEDEKLKAFVSIVLDACFVVTDIKIIQGPKGLFVSMPSKKRKDGTFKDIAHPLNQETRGVVTLSPAALAWLMCTYETSIRPYSVTMPVGQA